MSDMRRDAAPLLAVRDLRVSYAGGRKGFGHRNTTHALDSVSLNVTQGQTLGVVGESGSGKSTLGRAVLGLAPISAGEVFLEGRDVRQTARDKRLLFKRMVQCIFQDPYSSLNPSHTVGFILKEPFVIHGLLRGDGAQQVDTLLKLVGLPTDFKSRRPSELSGGQCQRVAIARALAVEPRLIICDEPTSSLDVSIQSQIVALLADLRARMNLSYVFISHDLAVIQQIANRVVVMLAGRIVEEGETLSVFSSPRHPYTAALLSAVPVPDPRVERSRKRLVLSEDNAAEGTAVGCRFRSRCWLWQELERPEICANQDPGLMPGALPSHKSACHYAVEVAQKLAKRLEIPPDPICLEDRSSG